MIEPKDSDSGVVNGKFGEAQGLFNAPGAAVDFFFLQGLTDRSGQAKNVRRVNHIRSTSLHASHCDFAVKTAREDDQRNINMVFAKVG